MTWSVISHIHPWPGQWYHTSAHDLVSDITSSHDLVSDITSSHDLVSDITHPAMTWSVIPYIQSALTLCLIFQWWGFQSCAGALNLVSVPQGQDWMANSISQLCVEAFAQIQSVLKTLFKKYCSGKSLSKLNISFTSTWRPRTGLWTVTLFSYRNKSL